MHSHRHGHSHRHPRSGESALWWALGVNVLLTAVQIGGGLVSHSLSLIADAFHNLSDAGALLVALLAQRIGRRPADRRQTFGYRRVELVGALINATALIVIGIQLLIEAVMRLLEPREIAGATVITVALIAFAIDVATAALLVTGAKRSLNLRAALIHNISDALGSLVVVAAGMLVLFFDLHVADTIATVLIAVYSIWQGGVLARQSSRILSLGTPLDLDVSELVEALRKVDGVIDLHHIHLWDLDEETRSFEAHIVVAPGVGTVESEQVKKGARSVLAARGVGHSTLELEFGSTAGGCSEGEIVSPH